MARPATGRSVARSPVQVAAGAVGVVFLLVGILGFVPGITQRFDTMNFVGHESDASLLGLFQVNVLHNIVHVLFGVVGLIAAKTWASARNFLVWGGAIYLVLWLYGLVIDLNSAANFVALNTADNWLHLLLGVGMLALGLILPRADGQRAAA